MTGRTVTVALGAALLVDGEAARVIEFDGRKVVLSYADGRYASLSVAELVARARSLVPVEQSDDPALVLEGLTPREREQAAERGAHIREVLSGYRSGYAGAAAEGEPRPAYSPGQALAARCAAKAGELSVSARTIERWVAAYRDAGEAGLVDDRQRRGLRSNVDPRWDAAVRAELGASIADSTPTRSAILMRVAQRLEREHGVGAVPIPARTTAYRRLGELTKGTNAVSGSAKARRSIADRPQGVYGRLRATRPGEYLILDTQDLDIFAMEPVTCRWIRAQLTVAQDLFDRQILGLKLTPVSTKALDVAAVLFEAVTGRSSGRPALGPAHGLPDHLVFTETSPDSEIWCPPETLVIDHGKAFLSSHVIGVCARLGISIQPAQSHKPTDKPTVERFFRSLREGLIQHLPAYKGPDLHSRGEGVEEKAFLFQHELEDIIRDWITTVYHPTGHNGLAVAEWPDLALSPNDMFAVGVAKAGLLRIPADPALAFEFLRVVHRGIHHYGVEIGGRRYNGAGLDGYRNATSPYGGAHAGKWPIRVNDDDVRYAWFQDPEDGDWHRLDWEHAAMLGTPFSDEAARYARILARRTDRFVDPVEALAEVLARWDVGEVLDRRERRMAARLSAERTPLAAAAESELSPPPPLALPGPDDASSAPIGDEETDDEIFDGTEEFDADAADDFYADALEVLE